MHLSKTLPRRRDPTGLKILSGGRHVRRDRNIKVQHVWGVYFMPGILPGIFLGVVTLDSKCVPTRLIKQVRKQR